MIHRSILSIEYEKTMPTKIEKIALLYQHIIWAKNESSSENFIIHVHYNLHPDKIISAFPATRLEIHTRVQEKISMRVHLTDP